MKLEPLKEKTFNKGAWGDIYYTKEDVAAAVAWLKEKINGMYLTDLIDIGTHDRLEHDINQAFADVVEPFCEKASPKTKEERET